MKSPHGLRTIAAAIVLGLSLAWLPLPAGAANGVAMTAAQTGLQKSLEVLAQRARPGLLGVAILDLKTGAQARVNASQAYPMMSVFKAPVAAAVFAQIDEGRLSLKQHVTLTRADLRSGSAVPSIGGNFRGEHMTFTVEQLLIAAVSESDNTAADALVKLAGGPPAVTAFLRSHGIDGMRVDLDEAGVGRVFEGLRSGEGISPTESSQEAHQRLRRGYEAFLADPRNRSTPDAAIEFLRQLWKGELLPPSSAQRLLRLMDGQTVPNRLRAGLPNGVHLADKCGTSDSLDGVTAAYNDIGVLTSSDGHTVLVAAFLTASRASKAERNATFADLTRSIAAALHP
ncbi:class A beta-lactamase [Dokdonella soli]|uniref:beta-lactamase n=1 Tax=Dokdonella soli TaxID=529810 RepID=A0ABP3TT39_9GAMM